jgi:hypothetical protein
MRNTFRAVSALIIAIALTGCGGGGDEQRVSTAQVEPAETIASKLAVPVEYTTVVQQLYIAYFGRPADPNGLANFSAQLANTGATTNIQSFNTAYGSSAEVRALIDNFGSSEESRALYPGDTAAFVNAIYTNVLGRAPDTDGLQFWVRAIDAGVLTKANASFSIMAGALANRTQQGLVDAELVNKRVAVGTNFTAALNTPELVSAYSGNAAAATARAMLATVTAATDVAAFQPTVAAIIAVLTEAASQNRLPIAMAGTSATVLVGTVVQLDGTASYDPDGDPISYSWSGSRPAGSGADFSDFTAPRPAFLADVAGTYAIALIVSDGKSSSSPSSIVITAVDAAVPVAVTYYLYGGTNDAQYLGCLNCNRYDAEAVCNRYGTYGSSYSSTSIWNEYGTYGSRYNNYSAWNVYASSPPKIIGSDGLFYGYFSANRFISQRTAIPAFLDVLNYFNSTESVSATQTYGCP